MAKLGDIFELQITGEWGQECSENEIGTKVLRTTNFTPEGIINYNDVVVRSITQAKVEKKRLRFGDIILEKSGGTEKTPVGRVVFCDKCIESDAYLCNNFTQAMRVNSSIAFPRYVFYFMWNLHQSGKTELMQNKTTGIRNLQIKSYLNEYISLPSLDEQKKIASVLDKVSDLIAKRRAQLDKLDLLVKARFVEMFGDLMFNPYHWPIAKISDVSTYLKSGLSRRLSDEDIGLPVIRSGNIQNGEFIYENIKYWYKDDPQGSKTEDYILDDGDILINFINSASQIGKTAIFRDVGRGCIYTTNIFRMKLADNCNEHYYNWFAMSDYYYRQLQNIIQPAVNQASFTTTNFLKLSIPLPPINKQKEFANFVKQTSKSTMEIQKSLAKLEILKKALMQKYFG